MSTNMTPNERIRHDNKVFLEDLQKMEDLQKELTQNQKDGTLVQTVEDLQQVAKEFNLNTKALKRARKK